MLTKACCVARTSSFHGIRKISRLCLGGFDGKGAARMGAKGKEGVSRWWAGGGVRAPALPPQRRSSLVAPVGLLSEAMDRFLSSWKATSAVSSALPDPSPPP